MIKQFSSYQIVGRGRAKTLGFPTINLKIPVNFDLKEGVYGVFIQLDGIRYLGAMHYGMSPTFSDNERTLEIYLVDVDNINVINNKVDVQILKYLRHVKNFATKTALILQIKEDVSSIKKLI